MARINVSSVGTDGKRFRDIPRRSRYKATKAGGLNPPQSQRKLSGWQSLFDVFFQRRFHALSVFQFLGESGRMTDICRTVPASVRGVLCTVQGPPNHEKLPARTTTLYVCNCPGSKRDVNGNSAPRSFRNWNNCNVVRGRSLDSPIV